MNTIQPDSNEKQSIEISHVAYETALERLLDALSDDDLFSEILKGKEVTVDGDKYRLVAHLVVP